MDSLHAGEFGVADEMLLEIWIQWALAAEPSECALGFGGKRDVWVGEGRLLGGVVRPFDADLDKINAGRAGGAGAFPDVHATRGDKLGLGERVGGEGLQDGNKVCVGEFLGLAAEQAADEAFREAGTPGQVALVEAPTLGLALEGGA